MFGSVGALIEARSVLTCQDLAVFHEGMLPCGGERLAFEQQHEALMVCQQGWLGKNPAQELGLSCLVLDRLPVARLPGVRGRTYGRYGSDGDDHCGTALMRAVESLSCLAEELFTAAYPTRRAVLAVLDERLVDSAYQHHFLRALPGTTLGRDLGDVDAFFRRGRRGMGSGDER